MEDEIEILLAMTGEAPDEQKEQCMNALKHELIDAIKPILEKWKTYEKLHFSALIETD